MSTAPDSSSSSFPTPLSGVPPRAGQGTPRKELVILITAGWSLVLVFVLTVLAASVPVQPRNLAWGQNLSRLIVDAGSLSLVGLCLVRYATYLRSLDLPSRQSLAESLRSAGRLSRPGPPPEDGPAGSSASRPNLLLSLIGKLLRKLFRRSAPGQPPRDPFAIDQLVKDKLAMERNKLWVRRLAIAGALGMLLLAPFQVVLFLRGTAALNLEFARASEQQGKEFEQLETALKDAPAPQILQSWLQLKRLDPGSPPAGLPGSGQQLQELLAQATTSRDNALQTLQRQASSARFALGRDTLRVFLVALVYSWAFWAFLRRI